MTWISGDSVLAHVGLMVVTVGEVSGGGVEWVLMGMGFRRNLTHPLHPQPPHPSFLLHPTTSLPNSPDRPWGGRGVDGGTRDEGRKERHLSSNIL